MPSAGTALLELSNVSVRTAQQTILSSVDLRVQSGEIVTLIGPNGAGKTTLVRVVLGLLDYNGSKKTKPNLRIGYMPQKLELNSQLPMTVKRFLKVSGAKEQHVDKWLSILGITALAPQAMQSVSGGELQRVLLARALMQNPELLVLDEPAQGVDINGQAELYQLIQEIKAEQNCGVLMVSHDLHVVMAQTDKVVCLNQHVCCQGHPEHVSNDPAFLALFGQETAKNIALYSHHHDHEHDLHGNVVPCQHDNK